MSTSQSHPSKPVRTEMTPDGITTTWYADGTVNIDMSQVPNLSEEQYREAAGQAIENLVNQPDGETLFRLGDGPASTDLDEDEIAAIFADAGGDQAAIDAAIHAYRVTGIVPGLSADAHDPDRCEWWLSEAGIFTTITNDGYDAVAVTLASHIASIHELITEANSDLELVETIREATNATDLATARIATVATMQVALDLLDEMTELARRATVHRMHRFYRATGSEQSISDLDTWLRTWPCECAHFPLEEFATALFVTGAALATGQATLEQLSQAIAAEIAFVLREEI